MAKDGHFGEQASASVEAYARVHGDLARALVYVADDYQGRRNQ